MSKTIKAGALRSPRSKYPTIFHRLSRFRKDPAGHYVDRKNDPDYEWGNTQMSLGQSDRLMLLERVKLQPPSWGTHEPVDAWILVHPKHGKFVAVEDFVRRSMSPSKSDVEIEISNLKSRLSGARRSMTAARKKYERKRQKVEDLEERIRSLQEGK